MSSCCVSLFQEVAVINLLASHGFIFHTLENSFWLIVLSLLGHSGRGTVASGILGLCIFLCFDNILQGLLNSLPYFWKDERNHQKWVSVAIFTVIIICLLYLAIVFLCILLFFPAIPLKYKVLQRAAWFSILLVPFLFLTGVRRILLIHHDHINRTRPILVASLLCTLSMFIGTMVLVFSYPMGLTGCGLVMILSHSISVSFLMASLGEYSTYSRAWKAAYRKLMIPICNIYGNIRGGSCLRSKKVAVDISVPSQSDVELTSLSNRKRSTNKSASFEMQLDNDNESPPEDFDSLLTHEVDDDDEKLDTSIKTSKLFSEFLSNFFRFVYAGIPSSMILFAESSWYIFTPFIISCLGTNAVDAMFIQLSLIRFLVWSTVYPLSVGCGIKIRGYLRSGHFDDCWSIVWLSFLQVTLIGGLFCLIIYMGKSSLWYWFTTNKSILRRCEDTSVFAAPYVVAYCYLLWTHSILRVVGDSWSFLSLLVISTWVVGCPLGVYFGIFSRPVYNLMGYWIGWITSGGLITLSLVIYCLFLISWKKQYRKILFYSRKRYETNFSHNPIHERSSLLGSDRDVSNDTDDSTSLSLHNIGDAELFRDMSMMSVFSINLGSFSLRPNSLDDDIIDIEIDLLQDDV